MFVYDTIFNYNAKIMEFGLQTLKLHLQILIRINNE